jgi:Ca2+-binding EF-hand superfamily protein
MKTCALLALCAASVKASDGEWLAQYFPPLADWANDCDTNTDGSYTATELYNCAIGNVPAETVAEFEARFDEAFESADSDGDGALNASELSDFQSDFEESVSSDSDGSDRRRLSSDSDALGEIIRYFPTEADFFTNCPNGDGALTEAAVYDCLAANVSEWRMYRFDYYFPQAFAAWDTETADGTWNTAEAEAVYDEIERRALMRNISRYTDYAPSASTWIATCDTSGEGEVTIDELYDCWSAGVYEWRIDAFDAVYEDMFNYFDANDDDKLTGDELLAFQSRLSDDSGSSSD